MHQTREFWCSVARGHWTNSEGEFCFFPLGAVLGDFALWRNKWAEKVLDIVRPNPTLAGELRDTQCGS